MNLFSVKLMFCVDGLLRPIINGSNPKGVNEMKKAISLLTVVCLVAMLLSCTFCASAEVPKQLTIDEVKTSPVVDGKLDDVYGAHKWNQSATELTVGEQNLFPRSDDLFTPDMVAVRNVMNMKGWLVYDSEALYIAVAAKDTAPKVASDNSKYWNSTNIQVVLFVDSSRYFFTVAYEGDNKVSLHDDGDRSELDVDKMDVAKNVAFTNNVGDLFYEIRIPFEALWDVDKITKDTDIRLGIVQTSMAAGYVCQAFGEAYGLKYDTMIPVTPVPYVAPVVSTSTPASVDSTVAPDADAGVDLGGASSDIVSSADEVSSVDSEPESKEESSDVTSVADTEEGGNSMMIILIVVGAVIVIGAVVAIILVSKKK